MMIPEIKIPREELDFVHTPAFARFILDKHLDDYIAAQYRISRELNLPVLKFFAHMSLEELYRYSIASATRFLGFLAENQAAEELESQLEEWRSNQIQYVAQDQLGMDDLL